MANLKRIYRVGTREEAEVNLLELGEKWSGKCAMAVRSWENNWEVLATFFAFPAKIRRLILTTNSVVAYNRRLRKETKNKATFPTPEAARKLFYLATRRVTRKWSTPIRDWAKILNQLAI